MSIHYPNIFNESNSVELYAKSALFDRDAIRTHFSHLHHAAARADVPGKMVLAVYGEDPDTHERFASVQHFAVGDVEGMTAAAMEFEGVPHRNVYAPLVILKQEAPAGTRKEEDIAVVFGFDIDGDADKGKEAPVPPLPADYVLESSAGNLQHFLFLDRPLPPAEARAYGRALKRATGAECADDIGHVWRVPGCLNWPNAAKIKRGRSREPQPVTVKQPWAKWTSVAELRTTLEPHWKAPRAERAATVASLDAPKFDYGEVAWWLDRKVAGDWTDDPTALSQLDWAMLGKAIKISFPDENGLDLWLRASHDADTAEKRWNNDKAEYVEGMRTLHWYLDRDITWMFRGYLGCQMAPKPQPSPLPPGTPMPEGYSGEYDESDTPLRDRRINAASLEGKPVPEREWLVRDLIPAKNVTLLYGDGGTGKSLLALQLGAAVVCTENLVRVDDMMESPKLAE
jgi:AAA domain/RepB DNA-primase from phage plasmid